MLCLEDAGANTALALRQVLARLSLKIDPPDKGDYAHNRVWWGFIQIENSYPNQVPAMIDLLREMYPHPPGQFKLLGKQGPRVTTGTDETTIRVVRDSPNRPFL